MKIIRDNEQITGADDVVEAARQYIQESDDTKCLEKYLEKFITCDAEMEKLKTKVRRIAKFSDPVLITGPTGTGKEILARALAAGRTGETTRMIDDPDGETDIEGRIKKIPMRELRHFVAVNMAGLPEALAESLLFGHRRGSFTGAIVDQEGFFQAARNGTIFLDEIGELPLYQQGKLLRVLQEGEVTPIGYSMPVYISCRVVAATNRDLWSMVENGDFKEDLYWRLHQFVLQTTSLESRPHDAELIARHMGWQEDVHGPIPVDVYRRGNVRSLQAWVRNKIVLGD